VSRHNDDENGGNDDGGEGELEADPGTLPRGRKFWTPCRKPVTLYQNIRYNRSCLMVSRGYRVKLIIITSERMYKTVVSRSFINKPTELQRDYEWKLSYTVILLFTSGQIMI